jgi:hypothetical protein
MEGVFNKSALARRWQASKKFNHFVLDLTKKWNFEVFFE